MNIYSKCTNCYNDLTEEEIAKAKKEENYSFPVCDKCIDELVAGIMKRVNKDY